MDLNYFASLTPRLRNFATRKIRDFSRRSQRRYQRSLISRDWYDLSARSEMPLIFMGGCGRSGTTLLREMINRHPNIFCGPETSMFGLPFWPNNIAKMWNIDEGTIKYEAERSRNLVQYAENFYSYHSSAMAKPRAADKTPNNVRVVGKLLTWFPKSLFVHVIRDGRDVACSLRNHPKEIIVNGQIVANHINRPISECATRWLNDTSSGLVYRNNPRYYEVRYEDLVTKPEITLRLLCEFIGETFSIQMLDPQSANTDSMDAGRLINNHNSNDKISTVSVGRWQKNLSYLERQDFIDVAGELLLSLGYVKDHSWVK